MPNANRTLFVTAWLPTETNWTRTAGIAKRQYLLLDGLKHLGGPIHVLLLLSPKQFDGSEPRRLIIEAELREFWKQGDLSFTICAWRLPPLFLDMDDVEHVSFRRRVKEPPVWPSKYLDYLQIPALIFAEWRAISLAAKTFVCSELDQLKLARLFRTPKVMALPNAVALGPK